MRVETACNTEDEMGFLDNSLAGTSSAIDKDRTSHDVSMKPSLEPSCTSDSSLATSWLPDVRNCRDECCTSYPMMASSKDPAVLLQAHKDCHGCGLDLDLQAVHVRRPVVNEIKHQPQIAIIECIQDFSPTSRATQLSEETQAHEHELVPPTGYTESSIPSRAPDADLAGESRDQCQSPLMYPSQLRRRPRVAKPRPFQSDSASPLIPALSSARMHMNNEHKQGIGHQQCSVYSPYLEFLTDSSLSLEGSNLRESSHGAGFDKSAEDELLSLANSQWAACAEGQMLQAGLQSQSRREDDLIMADEISSPTCVQIGTARAVWMRRQRAREVYIGRARVQYLSVKPPVSGPVKRLKGKLSRHFSRS